MDRPIKTLTVEELEAIMREAKLPVFRAEQILVWVYGKNAQSYEEMSNIPRVIREQFNLAYPLYNPQVKSKLESADKSRKYLIEFYDGVVVETVGLPSKDGRLTVCCSSQAGCSMGCVFCATGKQGLTRNLSIGEIIDQILVVQKDFGERVTNIVVMGQGEPFANYDAVIEAMRIVNNPKLLNIGARHITISTCGLLSGIERFSKEPEQFTLAISLHAARQEVRDEIMPSMANQRLGSLRQALDLYAQITGRRFSFEYALMYGVNDSEEDLKALISYCRRLLCHVNLIPLNEIEGSALKPVDRKVMENWQQQLEASGIPASIRRSRGSDILGACGQLRNAEKLATI